MSGKSKNLAMAYAVRKQAGKRKKLAEGGVASPTKTNTKTGGSNPGGASTGGIGSGIGGAGTGGAATGGASTGGAGTVNVTISGNSGTGSNSSGSKGAKKPPTTINISNVGGKTGAGKVASGDGPGSAGSGGSGKDSGSGGTGGGDPSDDNDDMMQEPKAYAKGGEVNSRKMIGRNSGNKPPKNDDWSSDVTVRQAQKPSITPLSQPKLIGGDTFSVRNRQQRDDNNAQREAFGPNDGPQRQPKEDYNEIGANRQGPHVPALDMKMMAEGGEVDHNSIAEQHLAMYKKHKMMAEGGPVMQPKDDEIEMRERLDEADMQNRLDPSQDMGKSDAISRNELRPNRQGNHVPALDMKMMAKGGLLDEEREYLQHESLAAAIMAKRQRFADGGDVIDIMDNGKEIPNQYPKRNREILDDNLDADMEGVEQLEDSNLLGDEDEKDESDKNGNKLVSAIRSNMKRKRFRD